MASLHIEKRKKANNKFSYKAGIIVKSKGEIIHRESKTFSKKELAQTWGKYRLHDIETKGIGINKAVSMGALLNMYFENNTLWSNIGRTKRYVIEMLIDCDISKIQRNKLKTSDLITHCINRKGAGARPATTYHDIAYLRSVMKKALPIFDVDANFQIFEEAIPTLIDMKLVGKSQKRTRRSTENELEILIEALTDRQSKQGSNIPFVDILNFSILTCMRIGEVCKIEWKDLNHEHKTIIVRDRKDPRKKEGNHMIVPLLAGSYDLVKKQLEVDDRIFPSNSRSVTSGFQRVRYN